MQNWIKCSERMPPDGEYVIVATDCIVWVETHFIEYNPYSEQSEWFSSNTEAESRPIGCFTYWQPLPEPPQE